MGSLKATNKSSLLEYGGYINPGKIGPTIFLARGKFVRRKATTEKSKVWTLVFNQLRDTVFSKTSSIVIIEEILPEIALNWD